MEEIWKDIVGFDHYQASNLGNIKSLLTKKEGKILSKRYDKDGYEMVWTKHNSASRVHKLVMMAFEPDGYKDGMVVNHINGIKNDNRLENLEWCTISENTKHGYDTKLAFSSVSEPVAVKLNGNTISIFNSIATLSKYCGLNRNTIAEIAKNKKKFFDELELELLPVKRYDDHELFENPFIKRKMSKYLLTPCLYDGVKYESLQLLSELLEVNISKVKYAIKNKKLLLGKEIKKITRYEYIRQ